MNVSKWPPNFSSNPRRERSTMSSMVRDLPKFLNDLYWKTIIRCPQHHLGRCFASGRGPPSTERIQSRTVHDCRCAWNRSSGAWTRFIVSAVIYDLLNFSQSSVRQRRYQARKVKVKVKKGSWILVLRRALCSIILASYVAISSCIWCVDVKEISCRRHQIHKQ